MPVIFNRNFTDFKSSYKALFGTQMSLHLSIAATIRGSEYCCSMCYGYVVLLNIMYFAKSQLLQQRCFVQVCLNAACPSDGSKVANSFPDCVNGITHTRF